jgi:hypothetical protein
LQEPANNVKISAMLTARMHDSYLVEASGGRTTVRGLDAFSALHNNTKAISRAPCNAKTAICDRWLPVA